MGRGVEMKPVIAVMTALALIVAACGVGGSGTTAAETPLLVSAAASLTDGFGAIAEVFESQHAGVDVVLNLAASSTLREQILEGAPVDVFASANHANMDQVVAAGLVAGQPQIFARNLLQIAVPAGNPARIGGLEDFARPELLIGLCAEGVPCGDFAHQVLANAAVAASIDTFEPDVRFLLTKIEAGELDAGLTYMSDVAASGGRVEGIDIPEAINVIAEYPIAVLAHAPQPALAQSFIAFVLSDVGQAILADYGFAPP
jgi:molybdate transport system substrate-binding protein